MIFALEQKLTTPKFAIFEMSLKQIIYKEMAIELENRIRLRFWRTTMWSEKLELLKLLSFFILAKKFGKKMIEKVMLYLYFWNRFGFLQ